MASKQGNNTSNLSILASNGGTENERNKSFVSIDSSSLPSALVVALLPRLAANDSIFAICEMTDDIMKILSVWIKSLNRVTN